MQIQGSAENKSAEIGQIGEFRAKSHYLAEKLFNFFKLSNQFDRLDHPLLAPDRPLQMIAHIDMILPHVEDPLAGGLLQADAGTLRQPGDGQQALAEFSPACTMILKNTFPANSYP